MSYSKIQRDTASTLLLLVYNDYLASKDEFSKYSLEVLYAVVTHCPLREIEVWREVPS